MQLLPTSFSMVFGDEQNTKNMKGTSVLGMGMNSSSDPCMLNQGLRDQDSRYMMLTHRALAFPSPENICIFEKSLHGARCRHLELKGQPDINSLDLGLVQSNWEIYLRLNNLVQQLLTITSFLLQTLFKCLGTMTNTAHPLLPHCSLIFGAKL